MSEEKKVEEKDNNIDNNFDFTNPNNPDKSDDSTDTDNFYINVHPQQLSIFNR